MLGGKQASLTFSMLCIDCSSKGKEGFGWIRAEQGLDAMEDQVGDGIRVLYREADEIGAIGTVLFQV